MTLKQINALKNVLILARERVEQFHSPDYLDAEIVTADNSIKIIRQLIMEQENIALAQADSEDFQKNA